MGSKSELDVEHVQRLLDYSAAQVRTLMGDALRHAAGFLGVEHDHPSIGVVKEELVARVKAAAEEHMPSPLHDYEKRVSKYEK